VCATFQNLALTVSCAPHSDLEDGVSGLMVGEDVPEPVARKDSKPLAPLPSEMGTMDVCLKATAMIWPRLSHAPRMLDSDSKMLFLLFGSKMVCFYYACHIRTWRIESAASWLVKTSQSPSDASTANHWLSARGRLITCPGVGVYVIRSEIAHTVKDSGVRHPGR